MEEKRIPIGAVEMSKMLRNESILGAKEMWRAVDRAAAKVPEWVKEKMDSIPIGRGVVAQNRNGRIRESAGLHRNYA
ncbi:MAG: hypothetical protein ACUVRM_02235 [Bacillota bacterium]